MATNATDRNLPRQTSGLVRNQAYVTSNDPNDEDGGSKGGCEEKLYKFLHIAHMIAPLSAFIISGSLKPTTLGFSVASGILAANTFLLDLFLYKKEKTRHWPKMVDLVLFAVFLVATIVIWTLPQYELWLSYHIGAIFFGSSTIIIAIAWAVGYPMTKESFKDEVDDIALTHPLMVNVINVTTGIVLVAFFISTMGFAPFALYWNRGEEEKLFSAFFIGVGVSTVAMISLFPLCLCYANYVFYHADNIVQKKYEKEVVEWMEKHPDHEITHETLKMEEQAAAEKTEEIEVGA